MPFEGVAQHDAVRTPTLMQICCCEAANLCQSDELFFTSRAVSFNNHYNTAVDFKKLKKCWHTIVRPILLFKWRISKTLFRENIPLKSQILLNTTLILLFIFPV
jgi:hypothetical protein